MATKTIKLNELKKLVKSIINENMNVTNEELKDFFEKNDFNVHLFEQDGMQCAEVETWTNGGVNMIATLIPFTKEKFVSYVNNFDIDEEIDLHRQGQDYKNAFTIRESVKDFSDYQDRLKEVVSLMQ